MCGTWEHASLFLRSKSHGESSNFIKDPEIYTEKQKQKQETHEQKTLKYGQ